MARPDIGSILDRVRSPGARSMAFVADYTPGAILEPQELTAYGGDSFTITQLRLLSRIVNRVLHGWLRAG